jgi:hypothetical protein
MNINYKRIIREEINRLILSEAIDASQLSKYIQPLKDCVSKLRNIGYSSNKEIDIFLREICTYFLQVIYGVDRCVKANNLNEDFRLSDYGVQYPSELGGNLWNDFENGLYKGANWARNQLYKRGYIGSNGNGASANGNSNTNVDVDNPNSVPSVKLMESLKKLQAMTFKWTDLKNRYQNEMAKYFNPIADGLTYISNINSEIVRAN